MQIAPNPRGGTGVPPVGVSSRLRSEAIFNSKKEVTHEVTNTN